MLLIRKRRLILSESGFTLIEMLVAVTLVAMMAVGLWSVFSVSVRSWSRGTEFIDETQRHRSILDKVRKQMASAYPLNESMGPPMDTSVDSPLDAPIDMRAIQGRTRANTPLFYGTETSMSFISLNSLRFQESPGLTLVSYEVAPDSEGNYSLVEKEARYTGQIYDLGMIPSMSEAIPIFANLSSCIFEYFDPGNNDNTSQWIREWNGQEQGQLPAAVSITMISRDPQGKSLNRHMVVPVQAQLNDFQINPVNRIRGRIRAVVR
jgi:prepilin-type N-terminal cleavage/methylation domain-containing protein